MPGFLPKEVLEGLELARKRALTRRNRLRVRVGDEVFSVLRFWEDGFALDAGRAPFLRGLVDLYDGGRHLYQCLIVASEESGGEMIYEFKRNTAVQDRPPLDYIAEEDAPAGLIARA